MDIGWVGRIDRCDQVKRMAYDFLEVALAPMNLEEDAAFEAAKAAVKGAAFPTPVFGQLLPSSMRIVGPDVDRVRIQRYLARVAEVTGAAGAAIVVLGGGRVRNVPEGWSRDRAHDQFLEMVSWCTHALDGTGVTLALEAQNHTETNFMTTIAEAVALAKIIDRPDVRVIADIYHLYMEPEPFDIVTTSAGWIVHVHLSDTGRKTPGSASYDFDQLFDRLKASGYQGRLSIECFTEIPEPEMRRTRDFVKRRWDRT